MLNLTSELAVKALIHVGLRNGDRPIAPRELAHAIGASPTYMAKVVRLLVKANILRARRGVAGGAVLDRDPASITLREIVEACQGRILGNYCTEEQLDLKRVCAFHCAMLDLHTAVTGTLSRWTLADLMARPEPSQELRERFNCRMAGSSPKQAAGVR